MQASPNMIFGKYSKTSQNGNIESAKSSANFKISSKDQNSIKPSNSDYRKMLEDIGSIEDESYAATKAMLKDKKAYHLEKGDTEKKMKRKKKLKSKGKGFKLNIPTHNKFLPDEAPKLLSVTHQSPGGRKLYNPTPTRALVGYNVSESGTDKQAYLSQLSNKGFGKTNESPFPGMFMNDSKWFPNFPTDGKNKLLMSPMPNLGSLDLIKYQNQFSNSMFMSRSKDNKKSPF